MNSLMLFFNRKEIDYELYFNYTLIKVFSNKQNINNKYLIKVKPSLLIFFWFKKIKEDNLDFIKLFNHLILLWLITSCKAKILNLGSVLNRGIKYFRCLFLLEIKEIYIFFNFINETLKPIIQESSKNIHINQINKRLYSFSDFNSFTNLRLSSNLYLNSVHEKLFLWIKMNNNINMHYYSNCLKI